MSYLVAPGSTSISADVFFADDTGAALTGKVAADFPACKWSGGSNTADTTITLTDLAAITTAHPNDNTAGGVKEREGGVYRVDLPNNMFTSAGRKTLTFAETTNKRILVIGGGYDCQYAPADLQTIKTQSVTCSGGVTVPAATLASTTNITAGTITTVTTVTNQLTAAAIATGVWQDATAGDFTTASSIGKSLYTSGVVPGAAGGLFIAGSNAATTVNITGTITTCTTVTNQLTAAAIATGVWQDTTAGDFTTASSIGKSLYTAGVVPGAAGGLFIAGTNAATTVNITGTLSTVTTVTNQLTAAQIATGVWQDATAGDFTTVSSIGKSLYTAGVVPGASGGLFIAGSNAATTVNITGNITGTVSTVTTVTNQLTAAAIATGVWQDATAGDFTTASSIGKSLFTSGVVPGASGGLFIAGSNAATTVNITGNITGTVSTVTTLTNLPSIPANWITAAGITAAALNGKGDWSTYAGGDTSGTTTLLTRVPSALTITGGLVDVNNKTGFSLAAAGLDSVVTEIGLNMRQSQSIIAAACAGVLSGANTTTVTILGAGVVTTRLVVTVDAFGNRSVVVLSPPA